ncbi:MAG: hypothetical protein CMC76_11065 [Flavobacteriaceae bacterium]|uniref:hypothetical protein n=1 Tax=Winogradskyella sp. SYSU M77433 TaxID=3042722 RepID=UPI000C58E41F|nr:hypothetical protein [Winogradskyella sp. SYSU M77433]MAX71617.1 hypothetical protein [Flavobacteriaceae bacterium]MDH7912653.1 hypothetical protein [Winogradskyella sp. SYSU M77433]|tara:strand:+ start:392 stop:844 length:453 start_codon:yes stop_codon:yes gene_type:complete
MKYFRLLLTITLILFLSCDRISNKAKEGINRGGEVVGESATEFFDGVSDGVDKTLDCEIIFSEELLNKGLKKGVYDIESQPVGNNNKLILYIIFEKDFSKELIAKAYNKKNQEIGRTKVMVEGKAGDAIYFDFLFDKRTDIGYRNKIVIE